MPLYLCALKEITPAPTITFPDGRLKLVEYNAPHTLVKKGHYLKYHLEKELDTPYFFAERKIFRLADDVQEFYYWRDKLSWRLNFDDGRSISPFKILDGQNFISTIFSDECAELSHEFRDWDAYFDHVSQDEPEIYSKYQIFSAAVKFASKNGALWHFEWDAEFLDEYLEEKKWYPAHFK